MRTRPFMPRPQRWPNKKVNFCWLALKLGCHCNVPWAIVERISVWQSTLMWLSRYKCWKFGGNRSSTEFTDCCAQQAICYGLLCICGFVNSENLCICHYWWCQSQCQQIAAWLTAGSLLNRWHQLYWVISLILAWYYCLVWGQPATEWPNSPTDGYSCGHIQPPAEMTKISVY